MDIKRRCNICNCELTGLYMDTDKKLMYYPCERCKSVFVINQKNASRFHERFPAPNACFPERDTKSVLTMSPMVKAGIILDICEEEGICVKNWLEIGKRQQDFAKKQDFQVLSFPINTDMENEKFVQAVCNADVISCMNVLNQIEKPGEFLTKIHKYAKPKSVLAIEVPRYPSMYFLFMTHGGQSVSTQNQLFSEQSLPYLLEDKFCVIEKWEYGNGYERLIQNFSQRNDHNKEISYQKLTRLSRHIQELFNTEGLADRMLILAKKR